MRYIVALTSICLLFSISQSGQAQRKLMMSDPVFGMTHRKFISRQLLPRLVVCVERYEANDSGCTHIGATERLNTSSFPTINRPYQEQG